MSVEICIRFLKLHEVIHLVALSRSSIYRRIAEGTFPPSRAYRDRTGVFWTSVEIERWQAEQVGRDEWVALTELLLPADEYDALLG